MNDAQAPYLKTLSEEPLSVGLRARFLQEGLLLAEAARSGCASPWANGALPRSGGLPKTPG